MPSKAVSIAPIKMGNIMSDNVFTLKTSKKESTNQEKSMAWVREKWVLNKNCELCGNDNYSVSDTIFSSVELQDNHCGLKVLESGYIYPFFIVSCDNCGNLRQFSAIKAGLVKKKEGEQLKEAPSMEPIKHPKSKRGFWQWLKR